MASVDSLAHLDNPADKANKDLKDLKGQQDPLASAVRTDREENQAHQGNKVPEENLENLGETVSSIFLPKV